MHYNGDNLVLLNTLRPRQNGCHFADDTFKRIFMNENVKISISTSLKFVPKGLINKIPALVQIMAWRRPGYKPLSKPMMVRLPTHICVAPPQWVKPSMQYKLITMCWIYTSFKICVYHTDNNHQDIAMMSHKHHGISNQSLATQLFVQCLIQAINNQNTKSLPWWSFVRAIHQYGVKYFSSWTLLFLKYISNWHITILC